MLILVVRCRLPSLPLPSPPLSYGRISSTS
nr:MAG TPA: hypothetical protein [Caudoviricetes sp.]DAR60952.1 MAG TPA: hypothetical protein [Caudoviricetes sp.]